MNALKEKVSKEKFEAVLAICEVLRCCQTYELYVTKIKSGKLLTDCGIKGNFKEVKVSPMK